MRRRGGMDSEGAARRNEFGVDGPYLWELILSAEAHPGWIYPDPPAPYVERAEAVFAMFGFDRVPAGALAVLAQQQFELEQLLDEMVRAGTLERREEGGRVLYRYLPIPEEWGSED